MRRAPLVIGAVFLIAACNAFAPGHGNEADREPLEQSILPPYPAQPHSGQIVRIDRATLDAENTVLTVEFVGGKGFLAGDGCSEDYEAWVGGTANQLEVAIVQVDRGQRFPFGASCTAEGYGHAYHLTLPERYDGAEVHDRSGGTLFVGAPIEAMILGSKPVGWMLANSHQECCGGEPAIWVEVYAAAAVDEAPYEGPGRLVLYQGFGTTTEWDDTRALKSQERGGHPKSVTMDRHAATVWVDDESGELLLAWTAGGRSYGLIGNTADMTPEKLVGFAESLTAGG